MSRGQQRPRREPRKPSKAQRSKQAAAACSHGRTRPEGKIDGLLVCVDCGERLLPKTRR